MIDLDDAFATLDRIEAAEPMTASDAQSWRPVVPVPADAHQLTKAVIDRFSPAGHAFTAGWRYLDVGGRLLGCVVRYDSKTLGSTEKQFRPFTFSERSVGRREWRCKALPEPRPLYGLDRLAARPDAPVMVVEGEKTADAAGSKFPSYVAVTSSGGSNAAGVADWTPLAGREVTIWRDADEPGQKYADDVVDMLRSVGGSGVRCVQIPDTFRDGWDLADELPPGLEEADLLRMLVEAPAARPEAPLPLFPPLPASERYPIEALGPVLCPAAAAICRKVQVPEAIAAQSVLAVASLVAQAHADVMLPYGQTRPLSLYLVTVAASGDRKSTADNEALRPVRRREQALKLEYERELQNWSVTHAVWNAERKKIEADKKMDTESRKAALLALGGEPDPPLHPFLTAPEPTVEGLAKAWVSAPAALGIFTAEGGQFIGGHGMSMDNRLKTAAACSALWDGQPIKRLRAMDGVTLLDGRRLAMHLMVQPDAASLFLGDTVLRDQGLLSRFLVAAPESIAGTRLYRDTAPEDEAAIRAYTTRLLSIMEAQWPLAEGRMNELEPRALTICSAGTAAWTAFHDHVEVQCRRGEDLVPIRDFAAKAAEHAARIAAIISIVENLRATEIGIDAMERALTLVDWYVVEALRLHGAARIDPRLRRAQELLDWMQQRCGTEVFDFRDIVRLGPTAVRTKETAEDALSILASHGWTLEVSPRPRRLRLLSG